MTKATIPDPKNKAELLAPNARDEHWEPQNGLTINSWIDQGRNEVKRGPGNGPRSIPQKMKTMRFLGVLMAALLLGSGSLRAENTAAINEVLKLKAAGLNDATIISFIRSKNIHYDISADRAIALRDQGLSGDVLSALLASGAGNSPFAEPPVAQPAPPPIAAQPSSPPPVVASQPPLGPDAAYFYQELSPYGRWILAEDSQWWWQPGAALKDSAWRPYWDEGRWLNTDQGWYWSSDYPWGWAPFHYGRWQLHPHHGWIWSPDRTWGPAWVVWRTGGDYCGWAPLPPEARYDPVSAAFFFRGRRVEASFDFGLDWHHFNFTLVREIGEKPRHRFRSEREIVPIFRQTTVINNYTVVRNVRDGETRVHIVNHGIDPDRVARLRGRPVERTTIEDLRTPGPNRSHERMDPKTRTLEVYRPKMPDRDHEHDRERERFPERGR